LTGFLKTTFVASAAIVLLCTLSATAIVWSPDRWKSIAGLQSKSNDKIWEQFSCRARLYLQKVKGEGADLAKLSWIELWGLTRPGIPFHCAEGTSLEASLRYSSYASEDDLMAGAHTFHERCSGCHGSDGSGGPHGPSLLRSEYNHGDSDLAIYKVLRDGVPGTAMPPAGLPIRVALQVIANLKILQAHVSEDHKAEAPQRAINVSDERLQAAGTSPDGWLTYSGSYNGQRYSPLAEITPANVAQLRARWIRQFDSDDAGSEATPLVIDGVIFTVVSASHVAALDAKSGNVIWEYHRAIPDNLPLCCGKVNRGLAAYGGTLFLGTLDGYLVAINANDGKVLWETSVASPSDHFSLTGAPLVVNHSVVVGVSGGEFGVRGFLAAYDAATGQQQWKFETIPGPGEVGHDTWKNDAWRTGGGPTWNTGSFDPSTGLLYWGVGNPGPNFAGDTRPGDNLFTDSVIALHANTGKLAWYFQFTPHDEHDWDSAQTPVLADVSINGQVRKVLCWANRNGFYYVLDRITGEFLAGAPFVEVNWAKGLTPKGRPILSDVAKVSTSGRRVKPGVAGATNWQGPAFDQARGSIFIPATESSSVFTQLPPNEVTRGQQGLFVGSGWTEVAPGVRKIRALDAATGRQKWEYDVSPSAGDFSSLLATGGGLIFGSSGGTGFALNADTGREVWRLPLGGVTRSSPISFTLDGRQVIAVMAGRSLFLFGS
jgi:alcohol dehydrogenase (cytochrome c)